MNAFERQTNYFLIFLILLSFNTSLFAQESGMEHEWKWKLVKSKNDVEVYIHKNQRGYDRVKILAKINAPYRDFVEYINQADIYPEWVYSCSWSAEIYRNDDTLIYSTITDMPFPFYDRILKVLSTQDYQKHRYETFSHALEADNQDGKYVSVPYFYSHWVVEERSAGELDIHYEVESAPGGIIPTWLYDLAVDIGPYRTMAKLKKIMEEGLYEVELKYF